MNNWIAKSPESACSIHISQSALRDRFLFVYAGNMGVAQGMDSLLRLAESLREREDIGFVFVGRGSESARLRNEAKQLALPNVLVYDEIDAEEIPRLYSQCQVGLLALDQKHKSHNILGKFLPYMQAGLPVLALINTGNDLLELIRRERVGCVITETSPEKISDLALELIDKSRYDKEIAARCKALAERLFSADLAAELVISGLQG
ncbi:MAG: glycosyltransferase [Gammaproteobacteria bacterium]|nr:glycosyltransferase [Gammaproteobacteria bacterium]MDG2337239.1 glycosyltransferase [Gammaproteobacteria bacterium]